MSIILAIVAAFTLAAIIAAAFVVPADWTDYRESRIAAQIAQAKSDSMSRGTVPADDARHDYTDYIRNVRAAGPECERSARAFYTSCPVAGAEPRPPHADRLALFGTAEETAVAHSALLDAAVADYMDAATWGEKFEAALTGPPVARHSLSYTDMSDAFSDYRDLGDVYGETAGTLAVDAGVFFDRTNAPQVASLSRALFVALAVARWSARQSRIARCFPVAI